MVKGQLKYIPKEMVEELANIKLKLNICKDAEAFKRLVEDSRIGREIRFTIDFNRNRRRK